MGLVELCVEFVEGLKGALHLLVRCHQVRYSEVVGAFFLQKSTTRNRHNTCFVHHVHTVHEIGGLSLLLSFVDELLGEVDAGEAIHGALNFRAGNLFHLLESVLQKLSLLLICLVDFVVFALVLMHTVS
jgi:hypothetical protein